jgi:hypothetical protein
LRCSEPLRHAPLRDGQQHAENQRYNGLIFFGNIVASLLTNWSNSETAFGIVDLLD